MTIHDRDARGRWRPSERKPLIAADYRKGVPVKIIVADHHCDYGNLYRILAEFHLPLRQPRKAAAIRQGMAQRGLI